MFGVFSYEAKIFNIINIIQVMNIYNWMKNCNLKEAYEKKEKINSIIKE
jgi:hypothetical protein